MASDQEKVQQLQQQMNKLKEQYKQQIAELQEAHQAEKEAREVSFNQFHTTALADKEAEVTQRIAQRTRELVEKELSEENVMLTFIQTQSQLNTRQLSQLEKDNKRREEERKDRIEQKIKNWAKEESELIEPCNGTSIDNLRTWIHGIKAAEDRIPENLDKNACLKALIKKTAKGDVGRTQDCYLREQGRSQTTADAVLAHVQENFLGPDELEALKDVVKKTKQSPREEIPAYNRKFKYNVEVAYPNPSRDEEIEITNYYLAGLKKGRIQDRLFDREPRLTCLADAQAQAFQEWARVRHKERVLHDHRSLPAGHEPMEVDALTVRETLSNQDKKIKELEARLASAQRQPPPQPSTQPTAQPASAKQLCHWCKKAGHFKKECKARAAYWERKGGQPRPLQPEERSLN